MQRWFTGRELADSFDLSPVEWWEALQGTLPAYTEAGRRIGFKHSDKYRGTSEQRELLRLRQILARVEKERSEAWQASQTLLTGRSRLAEDFERSTRGGMRVPKASPEETERYIAEARAKLTKLETAGVVLPSPPSSKLAWVDLPRGAKEFMATFKRFHFRVKDVATFAESMGIPIEAGPDEAPSPQEAPPPEPTKQQDSDWVFRKAGNIWQVRVDGGALLSLVDTIGLGHIAELLRHPHQAIPGVVLEGGQPVEPAPVDWEADLHSGGAGRYAVTVDDRALADLRAEKNRLESAIRHAERNNEDEKAQQFAVELEQLEDSSLRQYTTQRRDELLKVSDQNEKTRKRITRNIETALTNITKYNALAGDFLKKNIKCGSTFTYNPPVPPPDWSF